MCAKKLWNAVIMAAAVGMLLGLSPHAAQAAVFTQDIGTSVVDNLYVQTDPGVFGDRIVYADTRTGQSQIYLKEWRSRSERRLTAGPRTHSKPRIWGDYVAFFENSDLKLMNLRTGSVVLVQAGVDNSRKYDFAEGRIGWLQSPSELITYDVATGDRNSFSKPPGGETVREIHVTSDRLVVSLYSGSGADRLYEYRISTGATRVIASQYGSSEGFQINSGFGVSGERTICSMYSSYNNHDQIMKDESGTFAGFVSYGRPLDMAISGTHIYSVVEGFSDGKWKNELVIHEWDSADVVGRADLPSWEFGQHTLRAAGKRVVYARSGHAFTATMWSVWLNGRWFGKSPFAEDPVIVSDDPEVSVDKQPVVVLVSGTYADTTKAGKYDFEELYTKLLPQERGSTIYDVILVPSSPLNTGEGMDSTGGLDWNAQQLAEYLVSQKGRIGNHPVILVAHSYGGLIARALFSRNGPITTTPGLAGINFAGLIQFGSTNLGTPIAYPGIWKDTVWGTNSTLATKSQTPEFVANWNRTHENDLGVPIGAFGSQYLPDALGFYPNNEATWWKLAALNSIVFRNQPSDGCVPNWSWAGLTHEQGGAWATPLPWSRHSEAVPGPGAPLIVPQSASSYGYEPLLRNIASMAAGAANQPAAPLAGEVSAKGLEASASASSLSDLTASTLLPSQELPVSSDVESPVTIEVDTTGQLLAVSEASTPTIRLASGSASLDSPVTWTNGDGSHTTAVGVTVQEASTVGLLVGLEDHQAGNVTIGGSASGGPTLSVDIRQYEVLPGERIPIRAKLSDDTGGLSGSSVTAWVEDLQQALTLSDDGMAPDAAAADGTYSAWYTAGGSQGTKTVQVLAVGPGHLTRSNSSELLVGSADATIVGQVATVTVDGPSGKVEAVGITVPVRASTSGTFTVSAEFLDQDGRSLGRPGSTSQYSAGETRSVVVTVSAGDVVAKGFSAGPILASDIRVGRQSAEANVDYPCAFAETATLGPFVLGDFDVFATTMNALAEDPSPTGQIALTGQATSYPSPVTAVEYSFDGGTGWNVAEATDGAFDSNNESYGASISLTDGAYGVLVRSRNASGAVTSPSEWAGDRFIVDTVAPPANLLPACVNLGSDGVRLGWLVGEDPSPTKAPVLHEVTLDGTFYRLSGGPSCDISLDDGIVHTAVITPVDMAGNRGPSTSLTFSTRPTLSIYVDPWTPDRADGRYTLAPTVTVSADETSTLLCSTDGGPFVEFDGAFAADVGLHVSTFKAVDGAGNISDTETRTFNVSRYGSFAPPAISDPLGSVVASNAATFGVSGSGLPGELVEVVATDAQGGSAVATTLVAGGMFSATVDLSDLADGQVSLRARYVALDGDSGPLSPAVNVVKDTTPPTTWSSLVSGVYGENGYYRSPAVFSLAASDPSGVSLLEYSFDGTSWTPYTESLTVSSQGVTRLHRRATDTLGQASSAYDDVRVDSVSPALVGSNPTNGATSVSKTAPLTVDYSETVFDATGGVQLRAGGKAVACSVSCNGSRLTVTPSAPLKARTVHTLTVPSTAIKDVAGNPAGSDSTISFTTAR